MNRKLQLLQSLVRKELNTDDLGYLSKWLFQLGLDDDTDQLYFDKITEMLEIKFFTQNNLITDVLTRVKAYAR